MHVRTYLYSFVKYTLDLFVKNIRLKYKLTTNSLVLIVSELFACVYEKIPMQVQVKHNDHKWNFPRSLTDCEIVKHFVTPCIHKYVQITSTFIFIHTLVIYQLIMCHYLYGRLSSLLPVPSDLFCPVNIVLVHVTFYNSI